MDIQSLFSVKDKVVVVTGGTRGIGLMIAEGFVANGAKVYITGRDAQACKAAESQLTQRGPGQCTAIAGDLQDYAQVQALASTLARLEPGGIHVLVNNAGATWGAPIDEYPDSAFAKVLTLNVRRVFTLTQLCLPLLRKAASAADPARVINVGSIDGLRVPAFESYAYSASKAAVHHLTRALAANLGADNVAVNAVAPGPFESKMMRATLDRLQGAIEAVNPRRRIGAPSDMAGVCIYLASSAGSYVNGAVIPVDGGSIVGNQVYAHDAKL